MVGGPTREISSVAFGSLFYEDDGSRQADRLKVVGLDLARN
jgi:hypothetical protein